MIDVGYITAANFIVSSSFLPHSDDTTKKPKQLICFNIFYLQCMLLYIYHKPKSRCLIIVGMLE